MVTAAGGQPSKVHGLAHGEDRGMLIFFVGVGGHLADQILAAVNGITVVEDLSLQLGRANGQLAGQGLEEGGFACLEQVLVIRAKQYG